MDTQTSRDASKFSARILIGIIAGVVLLVIGVIVWNAVKIGSINDFEGCAETYPVMDSYPQRCRTPDGRLFTNQSQL